MLRKMILVLLSAPVICLATEQQTEVVQPLQYAIHNGEVKAWSSRQEWLESLNEYLSDDKKIQEYMQKREDSAKLFKEQQEGDQREIVFLTASPFAGAFLSLFAGADSGIRGEGSVLPLAAFGATIGGICGLVYYSFIFDHDLKNPESSRYQQLKAEYVEMTIRDAIRQELSLKGYRKNNGAFPECVEKDGQAELSKFIQSIIHPKLD